MQPKSRPPSEALARPTPAQPSFGGLTSFGLAVVLQQILSLVEEAKAVEGTVRIEVEEGLEGERCAAEARATALPAVLYQNGANAAHSVTSTQVHLSDADTHLVAEILIDIQVEEYRYLLLRSPKLAPDEHLLSPREREIVRLVARGCPNKTIADILEISPWTVNTYLRRIFAKLNVSSRAEMVAHSLAEGLLQNGN